jgi:hypothetical protein
VGVAVLVTSEGLSPSIEPPWTYEIRDNETQQMCWLTL